MRESVDVIPTFLTSSESSNNTTSWCLSLMRMKQMGRPKSGGPQRPVILRPSTQVHAQLLSQAHQLDGVIATISFRPGGWMQQSTVPRCAILSVGSTGG